MLLALAAALSVSQVHHDGYVTDLADVIPAAEEQQLADMLGAFANDTSVEIAVLSVGDVDQEPRAWGTALFNQWGIGKAATDNGVLILLVKDQRDVEVITGDGIRAALPDDWVGDMEDRSMIPEFKQGQLGRGLENAVVEIEGKLRETSEAPTPPPNEVAQPQPPPVALVAAPPPRHRAPPIWPWLLGIFGGVGALCGGAYWWKRKSDRTCLVCKVPMLLLDEIADDAKLDEGQRAEEQLGSVDYEVRVCPKCQESRTFTHRKWFSRYCDCSKCGYRTATSSSLTLVQATYDHGGQVQVTERCTHCGATSQYTRATARRTRPSSSSSSFGSSSHSHSSFSSHSSSSSFGGGHSHGGGAGRHW